RTGTRTALPRPARAAPVVVPGADRPAEARAAVSGSRRARGLADAGTGPPAAYDRDPRAAAAASTGAGSSAAPVPSRRAVRAGRAGWGRPRGSRRTGLPSPGPRAGPRRTG